MNNSNQKLIKEYKVNDVDKLIKLIDSNDYDYSKKLVLLGNEIDLLKLIKYYNLELSLQNIYPDNIEFYNPYKFFKEEVFPEYDTYIIGPAGYYGNVIIKLNIHGISVEIRYGSNYKNINSFSSKSIPILDDKKFVVLDIETTGLNPICDDIIEICFLKDESNFYHRLLPLENQVTNKAYEINKIKDDKLKDSSPLTQTDVNQLMEKFDLANTPIVIWSGRNQFDRLFLEIYFIKHNLTGLENLTFFNANSYLKSLVPNLVYTPKDQIAALYGINITDTHNAFNDCIIEKEIVHNLLNNNTAPLVEDKITKINAFFQSSNISKKTAELLYDEFCAFLINKHGMVDNDYDKPHTTYGYRWIDIHHVDEKYLDDIATRTNKALADKNLEELEKLKKYNKKNRLVYATKIEHFILHCLLNIINGGATGGPHYLFGDLLKIKIGSFEYGTLEYEIKKEQRNFYENIDFTDVIRIYSIVLKFSKVDFDYCIERFFKLKTYKFNEKTLTRMIKKVKESVINLQVNIN